MSKCGAACAKERTRKRWIVSALFSGLLIFCFTNSLWLHPALGATLDQPVNFDIPSQPLESALLSFGKQAHIQVVIGPAAASEFRAPAVSGTLPVGMALTELLDASGLHFNEFGGTITVTKAESWNSNNSEALNSKPLPPGSSAYRKGSPSPQPASLEEIVVSAQKREERSQDVPVPVTAIAAAALIDSNQVRLQDYYTSIPGLSVTPNDYGGAQLTIRGLTTGGGTSPTVGIVIDDVPYGSSTSLASGAQVPDIDPSDLSRVEVLRGPQGTLYGASSIGGLLKYVTVDPSTDRITARLQGGISDVRNGDGLGYNFRAAANVPLSDTVAIRVSGFTRRDPGYIDNPVLHIDGINQDDVYGGRLSALWRPIEEFSLKLSALIQHTSRDGSPDVDLQPGLGDLQQNQLRGTGSYVNNTQAYSATVTGKLGSAHITALSGYSINTVHRSLDYSSVFGATSDTFFGVNGAEVLDNPTTRKFTQEVRLSMPFGQRLDWLVGAFYNHEDSLSSTESILAVEPVTGGVAGSVVQIPYPSMFTEYAAFTDLTIHMTDRFDLQVGGRESQNRQSYQQNYFGPYVGGEFIGPRLHSKDNSFTYLVTPSLKVSEDLLLYARLASGYRPGGPNFNSAIGGFPQTYNHDTTQNYELGVKGDFLERMFSMDASLFYIDWKDIQLQLYDPTVGFYFANAGRAKSQGAELSLEARPITGMTIAAWAAYTDAVLTDSFPSTSAALGASGDRLPNSSRLSGSLSAQQEFPLALGATGFVGASVSYVGDRQGIFGTTTSPQRQVFPGYARTDLRAGAKYESWALNVFVNNVSDKRGVVNGGLGTLLPFAFQYIQPRTAGLSVAKSF